MGRASSLSPADEALGESRGESPVGLRAAGEELILPAVCPCCHYQKLGEGNYFWSTPPQEGAGVAPLDQGP